MQSASKATEGWGTPKSSFPEAQAWRTQFDYSHYWNGTCAIGEFFSLQFHLRQYKQKHCSTWKSLWQRNGENNKVSLMCIARNICFTIWWSKLISWPADRICLIKRGKKVWKGGFLICVLPFSFSKELLGRFLLHAVCVWLSPETTPNVRNPEPVKYSCFYAS